MAVPAFVNAGAGVGSTTTTLAVPFPASPVAGNLWLLHVFQRISSVADPSTPSGWTLEGSYTAVTIAHFWYSKIALGSESGNQNVTVTAGAGDGHFGRMYQFSGDAGTWVVETGNNTSGSDNTIEMPSQVTPGPDRLAIALLVIADDDTSMTTPTGGTGGTWTEAVGYFWTAVGSDAELQINTAPMAAAGTISGAVETYTGTADNWLASTLAIYKSPIVVVQSKTGNSTSATTAIAFDSAPASGNTIVLLFSGDDYNGSPDSGWTESAEMEQQTFHGGYIWWRISNGGNSFQYTIGSANPSAWLLLELSGLDTSAPYDISEGQFQQTSTSSYTTANITPTTGGRMLIAGIGGSRSSSTLSALTSWTNSFTGITSAIAPSPSSVLMGAAYRIVTGDGSTAFSTGASFPGDTPQAKTGLIIAFKQAAAATGIPNKDIAVNQAVMRAAYR